MLSKRQFRRQAYLLLLLPLIGVVLYLSNSEHTHPSEPLPFTLHEPSGIVYHNNVLTIVGDEGLIAQYDLDKEALSIKSLQFDSDALRAWFTRKFANVNLTKADLEGVTSIEASDQFFVVDETRRALYQLRIHDKATIISAVLLDQVIKPQAEIETVVSLGENQSQWLMLLVDKRTSMAYEVAIDKQIHEFTHRATIMREFTLQAPKVADVHFDRERNQLVAISSVTGDAYVLDAQSGHRQKRIRLGLNHPEGITAGTNDVFYIAIDHPQNGVTHKGQVVRTHLAL